MDLLQVDGIVWAPYIHIFINKISTVPVSFINISNTYLSTLISEIRICVETRYLLEKYFSLVV